MTEGTLRLANAPIVEAVLEINCDLPPATDLQALQDAAKERFHPGYPKARRQMTQRHEFRKEGEKHLGDAAFGSREVTDHIRHRRLQNDHVFA